MMARSDSGGVILSASQDRHETAMVDMNEPELNGVVVPTATALTLVPCFPAVVPVWSQARNVTEAVVAVPVGTKRSLSVERNNNAVVALTVPTSAQVVPLFTENCHLPPVETRPMTTIPCEAPVLASLTLPEIIRTAG